MSVNWIEGVTEFLLLFFGGFFFSTSPFGIPNGFGEDVVSPIQIHDPVLQVEFPFVLTSVNLGSGGKETSAVGVTDRWTVFQLTVDTGSNVFSSCRTRTSTLIGVDVKLYIFFFFGKQQREKRRFNRHLTQRSMKLLFGSKSKETICLCPLLSVCV